VDVEANAMTTPLIISEEEADAVVVGARIAGSAAAIAMARRGRRVIALDRAVFPSDALSTHVMFPSGVAELQRLGALDHVLAAGATPWRVGHPNTVVLPRTGERLDPFGRMTPVDGIGYGLCPRRPVLDFALVSTARAAGAEVRERAKVVGLVWSGGRVAGVRYTTPDGECHQVRARLVVGADGRRSTVAGLLDVAEPYRFAAAGRGLVFMYVSDPRCQRQRSVAQRWQCADTLGFYFPVDNGAGLVLFMPPKEEIKRFRRDPGLWQRTLDGFPELKARLDGSRPLSKLRSADDTHSYFRVSSGPGWALAGDAGHFTDPVVAQGIGGALRHGRLLGETVASALDDRAELDRLLHAWELNRDRECLPAYYLGLRETRTQAITQFHAEIYRELDADAHRGAGFAPLSGYRITDEFLDVLAGTRDPRRFITPGRVARWTWRAARRPDADRLRLAAELLAELRFEAALRRDLAVLASGRRAGYRQRPGGTRRPLDGWPERTPPRHTPGAAGHAEPPTMVLSPPQPG
jgi:menaquinone-9 beta-reductase